MWQMRNVKVGVAKPWTLIMEQRTSTHGIQGIAKNVEKSSKRSQNRPLLPARLTFDGLTWFAWYNFCRSHKSLRVTENMEAGLTDRVWPVQELLA